MSRPRIAHRAEFSVRCACGMTYNTDEAHVGKQIKCRCGRTVTIARPPEDLGEPGSDVWGRNARASSRVESRRTYRSRSSRFRQLFASIRGEFHKLNGHMARWLLDALAAMNSRRLGRRWTARVSWAWLALTVITWLLLITTSERFLPATLLAYGPRFVLLLPLTVLVPAALIFVRSALLPLGIAALVTLGPIMGGRLSWRTVGRSTPPTVRAGNVRVLSFNVEGGMLVAMHFRELVNEVHPDLIALQECGDVLWDTLAALPQFHRARLANVCTASRWPITSADSMPRADFARIAQYGYGGTGLVSRFTVATPRGELTFVNLHLETARKGLEALSGEDGFIPDQIGARVARKAVAPPEDAHGGVLTRIDLNARIRDRESERASVWSSRGDRSIPLLIVGDFNLPVESTIFRQHWGGFTDAFEAAGTGFGWSKREGTLLRIRIDHVLGNDAAPTPVGVWLGRDLGSDHLPVVADLRWRSP